MTTVFVELPNTKIELLHPLGRRLADRGLPRASCRAAASTTSATRLPDILAARDRLVAEGARVLGDGTPKLGAHDRPVLFLHPKDFSGTLIELEQA